MALRKKNYEAIKAYLKQCGANGLLTADNAFALVALQHHWGVASEDHKMYEHVDYMWRATTASVTLTGSRRLHQGQTATEYGPGDAYFACPFEKHSVEFNINKESEFQSKAAHFSFAVPANAWGKIKPAVARTLRLKLLEKWPKLMEELLFPTVDDLKLALAEVHTHATRRSLRIRVEPKTYLQQWTSERVLRLGESSLKNMALDAAVPFFPVGADTALDDPEHPEYAGLRLYRTLLEHEERQGLKGLLRGAMQTHEAKCASWSHEQSEINKKMAAKVVMTSRGCRVKGICIGDGKTVSYTVPATTAFPAMHGGAHDPAIATKFGKKHYASKHEAALGNRVDLASTPGLEKLVEECILPQLLDLQRVDPHGPGSRVAEAVYDYSVHAMSGNTPLHWDNAKGDGPAFWVGVICTERTYFIFRHTDGRLVVILLEPGDVLFFSGELRDNPKWLHMCLRDLDTPDTEWLHTREGDAYPEESRFVLQVRIGIADPTSDDTVCWEPPADDDHTAADKEGCLACGAEGVCTQPQECAEMSERFPKYLFRQDIAAPLLADNVPGNDDAVPFSRPTPANANASRESIYKSFEANPDLAIDELTM